MKHNEWGGLTKTLQVHHNERNEAIVKIFALKRNTRNHAKPNALAIYRNAENQARAIIFAIHWNTRHQAKPKILAVCGNAGNQDTAKYYQSTWIQRARLINYGKTAKRHREHYIFCQKHATLLKYVLLTLYTSAASLQRSDVHFHFTGSHQLVLC